MCQWCETKFYKKICRAAKLWITWYIYRALGVISKETAFIDEVYKNSLDVINRISKILYYDCTNYFFEIEQAEGLTQYGIWRNQHFQSFTEFKKRG